ncbi:hypothetical protein T01_11384 [Trichinella spiralis]|uniref:Uncharacterized protein n=1 Tax=Trichinella spiralis TaxID=6334 RepID=A0A0V0YPF8_TRISP|nr:hypothetical protein T01_11384 [Trichinella spiralis]
MFAYNFVQEKKIKIHSPVHWSTQVLCNLPQNNSKPIIA